MKSNNFSETLVPFYQTERRHILEDDNFFTVTAMSSTDLKQTF